MELRRNRRERKSDQKEIKRVQGPSEEAGYNGCPVTFTNYRFVRLIHLCLPSIDLTR